MLSAQELQLKDVYLCKMINEMWGAGPLVSMDLKGGRSERAPAVETPCSEGWIFLVPGIFKVREQVSNVP
jgi:hypothetical protein